MCDALLKLTEYREELIDKKKLSKDFIEMRRRIIKRKEDLKAQYPCIENIDKYNLI